MGYVGFMGLFDTPSRFVVNDAEYDLAEVKPDLAPGSVRRFTYGGEPKVIAQVPLKGGGTVEVHGYATHYTRDWVSVVWTDEVMQHTSCWVPSVDVRRPAEGEWHGRYVQFG